MVVTMVVLVLGPEGAAEFIDIRVHSADTTKSTVVEVCPKLDIQ